MAIYGGSIPLSSSKSWIGEIDWYYTQSTLLNTSTIKVVIKSNTTDGSTQTLGETCFYGTVMVAGKQSSFIYNVETPTETIHHEFEVEIRHNGSGRLPECSIGCTISAAASITWDFSSGILSGSMNIANYLPRIPTESDFDSIEDVEFGENVSISWTPLSKSYYYKLTFDFESQSETVTVNPKTTSMYTYSGFAIPVNWAYEIPNMSIGYVQVTLQGYSDSTCSVKIGITSRATFTITIPESFIPTFDSCIATINNEDSNIPPDWNFAISGHSKVNISAIAKGSHGSTIRSFKVSGPTYATVYSSSLNLTTDIIRTAGDKVFSITCTDSRGRISNVFRTDSIPFVDCDLPNIITFSASRARNADTGIVSVTVRANWEHSSINSYNNSSATLFYKLSNVDDWTKYTIADPFPKNEKIQLDVFIDELLSYNFKIIVTDSLGQIAEKEIFTSSNAVLLDFKAGGDGLGIGKVCEEPGLEVSMDATFYGNIYYRNKNQTLGNYIETFIDPLECIDVDLFSDSWISLNNDGKVPYYQTKNITGMTAQRNYAPPFLFGEKDLDTLAAEREALACVSYGITGEGYVTLYCLEDKPTTDIRVRLQGVIV